MYHHSTTLISSADALSFVSAYLEATITDASLHPNALLTESGPITPSVGETTGLVLHNLKHVEAGLKGEHLAADLTFGKSEEPSLPRPITDNAVAGATEIPIGSSREGGHEVEGEWQDKEDFERQQDVLQGEIGLRDNVVHGSHNGEGGQVPKVKATQSSGDKDAKRKAKKERMKKEQAAREAQRKKEKAAED